MKHLIARTMAAAALALLPLAGLAQPATPVAAADCGPADWTGTWSTMWSSGSATMTLAYDGSLLVTGTYEPNSGAVVGQPTGNRMIGAWAQGSSSGQFDLTLSPDCNGFTGTWGSGESATSGGDWVGTRIGERPGASVSGCTWTGTWDSDIAPISLTQSGDKVTGTSTDQTGTVTLDLTVTGAVASGTVSNGGRLKLTMGADCQTFAAELSAPGDSFALPFSGRRRA